MAPSPVGSLSRSPNLTRTALANPRRLALVAGRDTTECTGASSTVVYGFANPYK